MAARRSRLATVSAARCLRLETVSTQFTSRSGIYRVFTREPPTAWDSRRSYGSAIPSPKYKLRSQSGPRFCSSSPRKSKRVVSSARTLYEDVICSIWRGVEWERLDGLQAAVCLKIPSHKNQVFSINKSSTRCVSFCNIKKKFSEQ